MKTWKLLSGLFTLMSSFFVGFSGLVLGLDQAFKHESDKGESDGIFLAFFMFFGGLVSIFLRKSKVGGNIAIIILHAIIALIGFQSDATKYHIVGAWGLLCAAIAAYSLYQHYKGGRQTKGTTNKQVQKMVSNRQCPYCHADVPSGSAFCGSCGKELPKEIVCPQCGASVDANAQFCSNCGKNLLTDSVEETVSSQSEYAYEEEGENPIRKYIPYIIGAIVLVAICIGGWWYYNSSKTPKSNNVIAASDSIAAVDSIAAEAVEEEILADTIAADISPNGETQSDNIFNGHEAIDLGLSVYWAACNIGATSYEEYGDYISWGETNSKNTYTESSYESTDYDAAHIRWGGSWRLPTKKEFEELVHKCNWSWTSSNGIKGYKVQGTNGNSIFLPAAGQIREDSHHWIEERGYYWTSTKGSTSQYAYYLVFAPFVADGVLGTESDNGYDFRYWGYSIRPVIDIQGE